jgi:hypothetical protein
MRFIAAPPFLFICHVKPASQFNFYLRRILQLRSLTDDKLRSACHALVFRAQPRVPRNDYLMG